MQDMFEAYEFCIRNPHLEGAEVFNSYKGSIDLLFRAKAKLHCLDMVNSTHPLSSKQSSDVQLVVTLFQNMVGNSASTSKPNPTTRPRNIVAQALSGDQ